MSKATASFIALCVAAIALPLLERYGLFHWKDDAVFSLSIGSQLLLVVVLISSLFAVRRCPTQAVFGGLVCAYCLWQLFQNAGIVY